MFYTATEDLPWYELNQHPVGALLSLQQNDLLFVVWKQKRRKITFSVPVAVALLLALYYSLKITMTNIVMIPEIVNSNKAAYTKAVTTEIIVLHDDLTLDVKSYVSYLSMTCYNVQISIYLLPQDITDFFIIIFLKFSN